MCVQGVITQTGASYRAQNGYRDNRHILARQNYYWRVEIFKWSEQPTAFH